MAQGISGPDALARVIEDDEGRELRQIGLVDSAGNSATWSGENCTAWYGDVHEENMAVQGNMLVSKDTLTAMAAAFRDSAALDLAERLLLALEAGDQAGGDKRGKQSAALTVHDSEAYPWLDLRADEHSEPVTELRRVYSIAKQQLRPLLAGLPKRGKAVEDLPESVKAMLLRPPPGRPAGGGSAP